MKIRAVLGDILEGLKELDRFKKIWSSSKRGKQCC